ncbi:Two pore potassium channel protein sup-9 [Acropora cervicornis]|uniref:Two pore potassium channel protein sup-9 n=1 Tax=Acropora cervicornis TaxID=6130 RepID=A0AAD9R3H3_ACRCE|nr:Two pore potassium channel protein sup-9 [Acropora cervicornis]
MCLADGPKNLVVQIGMFLAYILLGALVFQALESRNEEKERETMLEARIHFQKKYNISHADMQTFVNKIEEIVDHGFSQHWMKRWTILGSLFFAGTVVTTIGSRLFLSSSKFYSVVCRGKLSSIDSSEMFKEQKGRKLLDSRVCE